MKLAGELFTFKTGEGETQRVHSYPISEVRALAEKLGIDMEVDKDLLWFLKEALVTILPQGWQREEDVHGGTKYHNKATGVTTETHPLLYIFRAAYHHILEASYQLSELTPTRDEKQTARQKRLEPTEIVALHSPLERKVYFSELLKKIEKKQESIRDMSKFEIAMKEVDLFYGSLFTGAKVPKSIEETLEYQCIEPKSMLEYAKSLGVHDDYRMLWLGRVFSVLPLPPLWKRDFDEFRNEIFLHSQFNVVLRHHPSKTFLVKYAQTLRFGDILPSSPIMAFLDLKLRPYDVDLLRLMSGEECVIRRSEFPVLRLKKSQLVLGKQKSIENVDGVMALEIAEACGIEAEHEPHLLGVIHRYLDVLMSSLHGWEFRYTLQGEKYWYHPLSRRAVAKYPFSEQLKVVVDEARAQYDRLLAGVLKEKEEIHTSFNGARKEILGEIRHEASELMARHLASYISEGKLEEQDAHAAASLLPLRPSSQSELDSLLFACPFRMANIPSDFWMLEVTPFDYRVTADDSSAWEAEASAEGSKRSESHDGYSKLRSLQSLLAKPRMRSSEGGSSGLLAPPRDSLFPSASRRTSRLSTGRRDVRELVREKALEAVRSLKAVHRIKEVDTPSDSGVLTGFGQFADSRNSSPQLTNVPRPVREVGKIKPDFMAPPLVSRAERRYETLPVGSGHARMSGFKLALAQSGKFRSSLLLPTADTSAVPLKPPSLQLPVDDLETKPEALAPKAVKMVINPLSLLKAAFSREILKKAKKEQAGEAEDKLKSILEQSIFEPQEVVTVGNTGSMQLVPESTVTLGEAELLKEIEKSDSSAGLTQPSVLYKSLMMSLFKARVTPLISKPEPVTIIPPQSSSKPSTPPASPPLQPTLQSAVEPIRLSIPHQAGGEQLDTSSPIIISPKRLSFRIGGQIDVVDFTTQAVASGPSTLASPVQSRVLSRESSAHDLSIRPSKPKTFTAFVSKRLGLGARRELTEKSTDASGLTISVAKSFVASESNYLRSAPTSPQGLQGKPLLARRKVASTSDIAHLLDKNLSYYISAFGSPFAVINPDAFKPLPGILPSDIITMGTRLGIKVTTKPFESLESDLLWIAYFQILAPLPSLSHRFTLSEVLQLPFGRHPGDSYFSLMLDHHRLLRTKELKSMPRSERVRSMVERSWLELRSDTNKEIRFNFLTGEETLSTALQFVKFKQVEFCELKSHRRTTSLQIAGSAKPAARKGRLAKGAVLSRQY